MRHPQTYPTHPPQTKLRLNFELNSSCSKEMAQNMLRTKLNNSKEMHWIKPKTKLNRELEGELNNWCSNMDIKLKVTH